MNRERDDWSDRGPRRTAELSTAGFWADGSTAVVVVSNLSYEGCALQSQHAFVRGETMGLAIPGLGKILAQIRWVKGNRAGARFITGDSAKDSRRARIGV